MLTPALWRFCTGINRRGLIRPLHAMQVRGLAQTCRITRDGEYIACIITRRFSRGCVFFVFCGVSRQIIAPPPGGNIVLADNGPMFKEMYAKAFNLLYKTVTSCTCSRPSSKPSAKTAKSRRPTAPSFLNQKPVLNNARSYIDPSYMVRSVAADTKDSHMCYLLASQVQCSILNGKSLCGECEMLASRWCMAPCTVSRASGLCARAPNLLSGFVCPSPFRQRVPREQQNCVRCARCHVFVLLTVNLFCSCFL